MLLPHLRKLSSTTLALLAYVLAAAVMVSVAYGAALVIEHRTGKVVAARLAEAGIDWITVTTDGLQVRLTGTAPREADRFRAVNMVGALIDTSRIRDGLDVAPTTGIEAPEFSVQMLRTEDEVQLSGLIPETPAEGGMTEETLAAAAAQLAQGSELPDMLETADYPAPAHWNAALAFGLEALERLQLSKVSVSADRTYASVSGSASTRPLGGAARRTVVSPCNSAPTCGVTTVPPLAIAAYATAICSGVTRVRP